MAGRGRPRRRAKAAARLAILLLGSAAAVVLASAAYGFWTGASTGRAQVTTGTLAPPTAVTATLSKNGSIAVGWTAPAGTPGIAGYSVLRTNLNTSATSTLCGAPILVTTTSCTDSSVVPGTSYSYRVTATFHTWTATSAASSAVAVGLPSRLSVTTQPSPSATAGTAFANQPAFTVVDANGNTVPSDSSTVTIALTSASGATLSCSGGTSRAVTAGVASFTGCSVDKAGTYTLTATDGALTSAVSTSVTISPGSATQIAFGQQPSNVNAAAAIAPAVTVRLLDQFGNLTTSSAAVDIAFANNAGTGTLSGTHPVQAVGGVATFGDLSIDRPGSGFTLGATSGAFSTTSAGFTVSVGPAAQLVFTQQPSGAIAGVTFTTQAKVVVQDAAGNVVTTDASTVTLSKTPGTPATGGPGTLSGCSGAATAGTTTFSGCRFDTAGTGYKVRASNGALFADSAAFSVSTGATRYALATPATQQAGTAFTVSITAQDGAGNTDTSYSGSKTVTFTGPGTSPSGAAPAYPASVTFAAGIGSATVTLVKAASVTLTATAGTLTGSTGSFTVNAGAASALAWTSVTPSTTSAPSSGVPTPCFFTCGWTGFGRSKQFSATVTLTDANGNAVSNVGAGKTVSVSTVGGSLAGGSLTLPASGVATTTTAFTFTSETGNNAWTDVITAAGTGWTPATASISK